MVSTCWLRQSKKQISSFWEDGQTPQMAQTREASQTRTGRLHRTQLRQKPHWGKLVALIKPTKGVKYRGESFLELHHPSFSEILVKVDRQLRCLAA